VLQTAESLHKGDSVGREVFAVGTAPALGGQKRADAVQFEIVICPVGRMRNEELAAAVFPYPAIVGKSLGPEVLSFHFEKDTYAGFAPACPEPAVRPAGIVLPVYDVNVTFSGFFFQQAGKFLQCPRFVQPGDIWKFQCPLLCHISVSVKTAIILTAGS
jgi:hypothetical protein